MINVINTKCPVCSSDLICTDYPKPTETLCINQKCSYLIRFSYHQIFDESCKYKLSNNKPNKYYHEIEARNTSNGYFLIKRKFHGRLKFDGVVFFMEAKDKYLRFSKFNVDELSVLI